MGICVFISLCFQFETSERNFDIKIEAWKCLVSFIYIISVNVIIQ